jgi:phage terminase small subunit
MTPSNLTAEAKAVWKRVAPELADRHGGPDAPEHLKDLLELYCETIADTKRDRKLLLGNIHSIQARELRKRIHQATGSARALASQLGLNAQSSRVEGRKARNADVPIKLRRGEIVTRDKALEKLQIMRASCEPTSEADAVQ